MATFIKYKDFQPINLDLVVSFFRIVSIDLNKYTIVFKQASRKAVDYVWTFTNADELNEAYAKLLEQHVNELK